MADQSRLDYLEGRVEEQSRNWERVFAEFARVDERIDGLSTRIDVNSERFLAEIGRLDQRIDTVGIGLSARIDALDQKLDRRIDGLRLEQATQFHWTIGIMTALITGVLAAILAQ